MGTPHFAHKRGAHCDAPGETIHHLKAKADIVLACQRAGYTALTEVAGDDWRADVLAVHERAGQSSARIAFEVQWSFLRLEAALYRQNRYARDGVRGCWFFRNPPPSLIRGDSLKAQRDLPLFHLWSNADHSFSVSVEGQLHDLGDVVGRFCAAKSASAKQPSPVPIKRSKSLRSRSLAPPAPNKPSSIPPIRLSPRSADAASGHLRSNSAAKSSLQFARYQKISRISASARFRKPLPKLAKRNFASAAPTAVRPSRRIASKWRFTVRRTCSRPNVTPSPSPSSVPSPRAHPIGVSPPTTPLLLRKIASASLTNRCYFASILAWMRKSSSSTSICPPA